MRLVLPNSAGLSSDYVFCRVFGLSFTGIWTELLTKCTLCMRKCEPFLVSLWGRGKSREGASCGVEMRKSSMVGMLVFRRLFN